MYDEIRKLFANDRFATQSDIQIAEIGEGYAKCTMPISEKHLNGNNTVMGGALFTLGHLTFSVAANSHGTPAVSLNASISYIRPCSIGDEVTAEATEISRTRKIGLYKVSMHNKTGKLIAEMNGTAFFKE